MNDLLNLLGLGTPLVCAAAVYGIFHFLDKRASTAAKNTLASLFKPVPYDPKVIAAAILEAFDRLYTRPLLSFRAFARSAFLTLLLTTALSCEIYTSAKLSEVAKVLNTSFLQYAAPQLVSNIFTDYLSLFLIRRWLLLAGRRPIASLIGSFLVGAVIVLFMSSVMRWMENVFVHGLSPWEALQANMAYWSFAIRNYIVDTPGFPLMLPAIAVNLWLIFFAIGLLCIKSLSPVLWLSAKMQWFLERGEQHPLEAIGYVGAFIVFVGVTLIQVVGSVL